MNFILTSPDEFIARALTVLIDQGWTPDNALNHLVSAHNGQCGVGEPIPVAQRINMNDAFSAFERTMGQTVYEYADGLGERTSG